MDLTTNHFYSNGKLLITGEYLVMYGAKSLAIPVKFGQDLNVSPGNKGLLQWDAFIMGKKWFSVSFDLTSFEVIRETDKDKSSFLKKVILGARKLNSKFLLPDSGYSVKTQMNYPQEWGLGSSSTLISNIAWWAKIDPMILHQLVSEGSGYDIACARSDAPIVYQIIENKPTFKVVEFHPSFADNIFFLYLEKKQDTDRSIRYFRENYNFLPEHINYISDLTTKFISAENLEMVIKLIEKHESFMSKILSLEPVKQKVFPDFKGAVKSLGAWGGDFVMIATPLHFDEVKSYFQNKGFKTLFKFKEMVIEHIKS